jgi:hypothetical protein
LRAVPGSATAAAQLGGKEGKEKKAVRGLHNLATGVQ